jgi:DNA-binding LytR/AlgR family response regulator
MNLSCIIVEDLQVAAEYLKKCCEKCGIEVKMHCTNVKDATEFLNNNYVDLIFLDVEMPGGQGFEVLDHISFSPRVILTTSKTEYAYNAFEYNVTDFLKKPFTFQRFESAIRKAASISGETKKEDPSENHIFIKSDGKLIRLKNEDILFIESMGDYVKFVTLDKKYIVLNTIKNLETKVNLQFFMKVHRSYIVNMQKIDNIRDNSLFISGLEVPISKAFRSDVIRRFKIV